MVNDKQKQEIVGVKPVNTTIETAGQSPIDRILAAVQAGLPPEYFEKMLAIQERFEANQAKKLYAKGFASIQAEVKAVVKNKKNEQTHSNYADLGNVIKNIQPIYTEYGFAIIFYEGKAEEKNSVRVGADVLHEAGHKESYYLDVPMDGVGIKGNANMTAIHAKASSIAYGRRYLLCMIFNIPTADNDGVLITGKTQSAAKNIQPSTATKPTKSAVFHQ